MSSKWQVPSSITVSWCRKQTVKVHIARTHTRHSASNNERSKIENIFKWRPAISTRRIQERMQTCVCKSQIVIVVNCQKLNVGEGISSTHFRLSCVLWVRNWATWVKRQCFGQRVLPRDETDDIPFCVQRAPSTRPDLHDGRTNNSNWFCCLRFVKVAAEWRRRRRLRQRRHRFVLHVLHTGTTIINNNRHASAPVASFNLRTFFHSSSLFPISQWTAIIFYAEVSTAAAATLWISLNVMVDVVVVVIAVVAYLILNPFRTRWQAALASLWCVCLFVFFFFASFLFFEV